MGWGRVDAVGSGMGRAIIFTMAIDFVNACVFCFVIAAIIAVITGHEDAAGLALFAGTFGAARAMVWVQDNFKLGGLTMEDKWYLSITFWLNILAVVVAVVTELFGFGDFEPAPWVDGVVVAVIAIINLVRHFFPNLKLGSVTL